MENNQPEKPKTIDAPFMKPDSMIKIEVSSYYYARCQKLLFALAGHMGNDNFKKALDALKENKKIESLEEGLLDVLVPLLNEIERAANEQGCIETRTYTADEIMSLYDSI